MKTNIPEILKNYNIKTWTEGNNVQQGWVNIQCPCCGDRSNHGGFNLLVKETYYNCWRCGRKDIAKIFKLLNIPLFELKNKTHDTIIEKYQKKEKISFKLPGQELNAIGKKYLFNRGFDPDLIQKKYKIKQGSHVDKDWKFRIIIPIIYNDQIISFTSRDYSNKQNLRYKSCSENMEIISHKSILYNIDNCQDNYIFVVEGIFDCWRLGDNCCSTFGLSYTKNQVNLLSKYETIFIIFDNEKKAQEKAEKLGNELSGIGLKVFQITIAEQYKDLAEMPQPEANIFKRGIEEDYL